MTHAELLKRITVRSDIFDGKPIIRDMRISVELFLSLLAQGVKPEAILADYPELEPAGPASMCCLITNVPSTSRLPRQRLVPLATTATGWQMCLPRPIPKMTDPTRLTRGLPLKSAAATNSPDQRLLVY